MWCGWTGPVNWGYPDMYQTLGLVPDWLRQRRLEDLERGADFAYKLGADLVGVANIERYDDALEKSKNGSTPEERQKALKTMQTMERNWPGLEVAKNQYETAKKIDKQIRPNIKSAPKESGNGKAHSIKKPVDGVFLN